MIWAQIFYAIEKLHVQTGHLPKSRVPYSMTHPRSKALASQDKPIASDLRETLRPADDKWAFFNGL